MLLLISSHKTGLLCIAGSRYQPMKFDAMCTTARRMVSQQCRLMKESLEMVSSLSALRTERPRAPSHCWTNGQWPDVPNRKGLLLAFFFPSFVMQFPACFYNETRYTQKHFGTCETPRFVCSCILRLGCLYHRFCNRASRDSSRQRVKARLLQRVDKLGWSRRDMPEENLFAAWFIDGFSNSLRRCWLDFCIAVQCTYLLDFVWRS